MAMLVGNGFSSPRNNDGQALLMQMLEARARLLTYNASEYGPIGHVTAGVGAEILKETCHLYMTSGNSKEMIRCLAGVFAVDQVRGVRALTQLGWFLADILADLYAEIAQMDPSDHFPSEEAKIVPILEEALQDHKRVAEMNVAQRALSYKALGTRLLNSAAHNLRESGEDLEAASCQAATVVVANSAWWGPDREVASYLLDMETKLRIASRNPELFFGGG